MASHQDRIRDMARIASGKNAKVSGPAAKVGKVVAAEGGPVRELRGARRKRETRERLVDAAFRLMAERGVNAVAINEITDAADVGIGSFYNHFETKETLYAAVLHDVFEDFADALDRMLVGIEDPAEIISISVRHTLIRARNEPLWGLLLVREGQSSQVLSRGLGARLMRDIQRGIVAKRFQIPDPLMSLVALGSGVLGAVAVELQVNKQPQEGEFMKLGLDTRNIPERTAAVILHGLGLTFEQAQKISQRPLPVIDPQRPATK